MEKTIKSNTQAWIDRIVKATIARLAMNGVSNPNLKLVVSPGFCSGGSRKTKVLGECFDPRASSDGATNHVFLNPRMQNSITVMSVIVHEVIHAVIGIDKKHGKEFKNAMMICDLTGKAKSTVFSQDGIKWANAMIDKYGEYPRPSFVGSDRKQATNMLKAQCPICGYTIRLTQKWINYAEPICPSGECEALMVIGGITVGKEAKKGKK